MNFFIGRMELIVIVALLICSVVRGAAPPTIESIIGDFESIEEKLFVLNDKLYVQYTSTVAEKRLLKPGEKNPYLSVHYINARKGNIWGVRSILVGEEPDGSGRKSEMTFYSTQGNVLDWTGNSNHAVVAPF